MFLDDRINEFRLDEHIGRGGFGTVYRASQMQGDQHLRWVAVKMMHLSAGPSSYADMDIPLESYHKELTGLQFNHKNLVTYHSTGIGTPESISETYRRAILCNPGERGPSLPHPLTECERSSRGDAKVPFVWIAMEYSEAGSLDKEIQHRLRTGGTFDVDEAVGITVQILEGVDYLHRNGVNHRDIKPANILRFRESDLWKVSDFGLTGLTDESGYGRDRSLFLRFGTRGWMAPEQERGGPVNNQADLYSVGQIIYLLLTRSFAFEFRGPVPSPSRKDGDRLISQPEVIAKSFGVERWPAVEDA